MIEYKKISSSETLILHNSEIVGNITIKNNRFVVDIDGHEIRINKQDRNKVKPHVEKFLKDVENWKEYERISDLKNMARGMKIKS